MEWDKIHYFIFSAMRIRKRHLFCTRSHQCNIIGSKPLILGRAHWHVVFSNGGLLGCLQFKPQNRTTTLVSGGCVTTTPVSLRLVSGHQSTQTSKSCQHKVPLLKLRRVNKRLQGSLSTMKTTVSELKNMYFINIL